MTPTDEEQEDLLTTAQALELAGVSRSTFERWIVADTITVYRAPGLPRQRRFKGSEIRALITPTA